MPAHRSPMNEFILSLSIIAVTVVVIIVGRHRIRTGRWGARRVLVGLTAVALSALAPGFALQLGAPEVHAPLALAIAVGGIGIVALSAIETLSRSPRKIDPRQ